MAERVVEIERRIAATPDEVFAHLTEPEKYTRWKGQQAELDPRPGGLYRVRMGPEAVALGEYVEVERPSRVVFTWGWEGSGDVPPGSTTVKITLREDGDGTLPSSPAQRVPFGRGCGSPSRGLGDVRGSPRGGGRRGGGVVIGLPGRF